MVLIDHRKVFVHGHPKLAIGVPHYPEFILHCRTSIAVDRLLGYRASIISMCLVQVVFFLKEVINIINVVMSVFSSFFQ